MPLIVFLAIIFVISPFFLLDMFKNSNAETFVKFRKDIRDYDARRAKVLEEKIY